MKPSSARIAARRGNALKLVFAARNRMSAVAAAKAGTNNEVRAEHGLGDQGHDRRARPAAVGRTS